MVPQAVAGDKIEFSTPAPELGWKVPFREVEQKEKDKAPAETPHFSSYQPADVLPVYQETTVIIPRSREMDKHAWDSRQLGSRMGLTSGLDKKKLTIMEQFLETESNVAETNGPAKERSDRSFGSDDDSRSRKEPEKMDGPIGSLRSENLTLFGQEKDKKDDGYGDRYGQTWDSVPWMKGLHGRDEPEPERLHHSDLERMHNGDFVQFESEKNPFAASEAASGFDVGNRMDEALRNASSPLSDPPTYSTLPGALPGANVGEAFSAKGMSSAWAGESMPAASTYSSPASASPVWSAGAQSFGAPATLPMPHRPGSLFQ